MTQRERFAVVSLAELTVGENVRRDAGDVSGLADSIRSAGILQPLICCPNEDGTGIEVLMGRRRFAAAEVAGLTEVPCLLRPRPTHRDRVLMQVAENLERADMTPIDEALAFQELIELDVTRAQIARATHRSQGWVTLRLQLLDLPDCLRMGIDLYWITPNVALEVPPEFRRDRKRMARCAKILVRGNQALRTWLREEGAFEDRSDRTRGGTNRTVNISIETHELAVGAARSRHQRLGAWVEAAIRSYAADGG